MNNGESVFTPQLIINGTDSVVGSEEGKVRYKIAAAEKQPLPVQVSLLPTADGKIKLT